ncbi:MAG: hypothetical protein LUG93_01200 [Lachnospiraceae bacterium]|nr:hypothetical protein [Lachnospiraceae bacterium]
MSMETYENAQRRLAMYGAIEVSEQQIDNGDVKDADEALKEIRAKYGIISRTFLFENHQQFEL